MVIYFLAFINNTILNFVTAIIKFDWRTKLNDIGSDIVFYIAALQISAPSLAVTDYTITARLPLVQMVWPTGCAGASI